MSGKTHLAIEDAVARLMQGQTVQFEVGSQAMAKDVIRRILTHKTGLRADLARFSVRHAGGGPGRTLKTDGIRTDG